MERSGGALRSVEHFLCRSARSLNHVGSSVSVRSAVYSNHRCNTPSGPLIPPPYHFVAAASNSCLAEPGLVWVTMPNQGVNPHYSGFRIGEVVLNFARWLSRPKRCPTPALRLGTSGKRLGGSKYRGIWGTRGTQTQGRPRLDSNYCYSR
jgi:hypothetical protein